MQECRNRLLFNVETEAILNVKSENILLETFDLNRVIEFPDELKTAQPEERQKWVEENWGTDRNCIYNRPRKVWSEIDSNTRYGPDPRIWKMMDWKHPYLFEIEFHTAYEPPRRAVAHLARMNPSAFILLEYGSNSGFTGASLYAGGEMIRATLDQSHSKNDFKSDWLVTDFKNDWFKFSDHEL